MSSLKLVALLALTALIAQLPVIHAWLIWDRAEIANGQWWRIVTGNLTHTNHVHLLMNLAGLAALAMLHRRYYGAKALGAMIWLMMLAVGIAMFFSPYDWYAGLSGVLHGLFVWGVVKDIQNKVPLGWLMFVAVVLKLGYEAYAGGDSMTAALIDAGVAYQAHLAGALVGLAFALVWKEDPRKSKERS